jgi:hypothetical protein
MPIFPKNSIIENRMKNVKFITGLSESGKYAEGSSL